MPGTRISFFFITFRSSFSIFLYFFFFSWINRLTWVTSIPTKHIYHVRKIYMIKIWMIFEYGVSIPDIHYKSYVSMRIVLCACRFLETIKFALGKMVTVHCYHQPPQPPSPFSWLPTSPPAPSGQLRVLLARRETRVKRRFVYLPPNAAPLRLMFLSDPTISYTFS